MDCQLVDQIGSSSYTAGFDPASQTVVFKEVGSVFELVITMLCRASSDLFDLTATVGQAIRQFPPCPSSFGNVSVTLPGTGEWLTLQVDSRSATTWPSTATLDIQTIWISGCQEIETISWWVYLIIACAITIATVALFLFFRSNRYQLVNNA
jgi:hypothetical protein